MLYIALLVMDQCAFVWGGPCTLLRHFARKIFRKGCAPGSMR